MEFSIELGHRIVEKPTQTDFKMHAHDSHEIICFLSGDAEYFVEGNRYNMQRGDLMLMRKSESHNLILRSNATYERYVVNFDLPFLAEIDPDRQLLRALEGRPLGKFNHYSAALFPDNHWVYYFKKMNQCSNEQGRLAYLLSLLQELAESFEIVKAAKQQEGTDLVAGVVSYINQNLTGELSLSLLCDRFYISKAHLNRIFKQSTGSTVWRYILIKRLLLARELLISGKEPKDVYILCGFQDYTTFFRAYKKQFGVSPKNDQNR